MSNEMLTDLPTVTNSTLSDLVYAVQANISVQESLQQIFNLFIGNSVLTFSGNPNTNLEGTLGQFCYDTLDSFLYLCTSSGTSSTAVWTLLGANILKPTNGGTGISNPTAHTLPVAEGSSNFNFIGPLTNGQILIGSTGIDPVPTTITAGANITITNNPGEIVIQSTGTGSFSWNVVAGTSQSMVSNNGYIANNAGLVTLTLPTSSNVGDTINIVGEGAGGWMIAQGASQIVHIGSLASTAGSGGSVSSSNRWDSVELVCITANTAWTVTSGPQGNLTIV